VLSVVGEGVGGDGGGVSLGFGASSAI
jgi:hypothetical protein